VQFESIRLPLCDMNNGQTVERRYADLLERTAPPVVSRAARRTYLDNILYRLVNSTGLGYLKCPVHSYSDRKTFTGSMRTARTMGGKAARMAVMMSASTGATRELTSVAFTS
jgi:hypothetical protein